MKCDKCGADAGFLKNICDSCFDDLTTDSKLPKLINCHDCDKEISARATTCPHCGCPTRKNDKSASSPFAIACILTSVIVLFTPVIFINFVVIASFVLGIFSFAKKENLKLLAIIGILIALIALFSASRHLDDARLKLEKVQQGLENLQK